MKKMIYCNTERACYPPHPDLEPLEVWAVNNPINLDDFTEVAKTTVTMNGMEDVPVLRFTGKGSCCDKVWAYLTHTDCDSDYHIIVNMIMTERPPLGIKPRYIWLEDRAQEIKDAMDRHNVDGRYHPVDWLTEYMSIQTELVNYNTETRDPTCFNIEPGIYIMH